jgi:hypothetical protein
VPFGGGAWRGLPRWSIINKNNTTTTTNTTKKKKINAKASATGARPLPSHVLSRRRGDCLHDNPAVPWYNHLLVALIRNALDYGSTRIARETSIKPDCLTD